MARNKGSPHRYIPNEEHRTLASQMSAVGCTQEQISKVIGISVDTLAKHYLADMDAARSKANAKVAQTLYQKAIKGDTVCMIFWLKCQARWTERTEIEHSGGLVVNVKITNARTKP